MSTIETTSESSVADGVGPLSGIAAWLTTTDHKRIGRLFVVTSLLMVVVVGVIGVLLGLERADTGAAIFDAAVFSELFQGLNIGLVLGVLAPIGVGLSIAIVPLQLGARSMAFPRVALAAYYGWLGGLGMVIVALFNDGGMGGGDPQMVGLFLLGHGLIVVSLVAASITVATSVLTTRAPGMSLHRVPPFSWSALIASVGAIIALPVAIGSMIYLFLDLRYDGTTLGGADGIATWLGWLFTQPLTILLALPALGVFSELVPVSVGRRQPLRSGVLVGLGLVGFAALAGVTQQSIIALPWTETPMAADRFGDLVVFALFNLLPVLGIVIVFALGLLAAKPSGERRLPKVSGSLLFSFFGLGMILVGAIASAVGAIDDLELAGTVFQEGALVYIVYGAVLGILGGVVHWAPKLWGRRFPAVPVIGLALVGVLATILASLPYVIAGFAGQPAASASFTYSGPASLWNVLVLAGHALMVLTVLGFLALALRTFTGSGSPAGDDPWDAQTIEWATTSPAPGNNYPDVPVIGSAEPLLDLKSARSAHEEAAV